MKVNEKSLKGFANKKAKSLKEIYDSAPEWLKKEAEESFKKQTVDCEKLNKWIEKLSVIIEEMEVDLVNVEDGKGYNPEKKLLEYYIEQLQEVIR